MSANERREKSNAKIKLMGLTCFEELPVIQDSSQIKLKELDEIGKKAIASLIAIQVAQDINKNEYENSIKFFKPMLEKYGVSDYLNSLERKMFDGNYSMQDAINVSWEYETYWTLVWALGLIGDISDASNICDCEKAIELVQSCETFEQFKSKCRLRDVEEILDMLDLYYRYDWAVTDKRINPETEIGALNHGVVVERRRGLEWLISDQNDWHNITLDT